MSDDSQRTHPETLRLKSVSAALTVNDLQVSLDWYCGIVGFHLESRFEHEGVLRGAELVAGDQAIVLSQDDWAKGRDRPKGQAIRLYFQTSQDVDEVAAAITARGGTLASDPADMPWGARAFNLVDPDGFHMTISS
ncbi:MAG TPA: VOC family protein [Longimicrobiales bacterium]|jgi:uncharacterized glyoxalase superfamily protein PhnB